MKKLLSVENIGFGSLQWFFWSAYCTLFAFLVLYLKTKNYDEVQIGIIMSAISIASIIGQPFWGHYSDRKNTLRNVLVVCLLVSGLIALLIPLFINSYILIISICLVISFTENSMSSIIDSWTMNSAVKKTWIDYGLTRGMGSLGYAITAVLFGVVLDKFGYGQMFSIHFTLVLITVGFCFYVEKHNKISPITHSSLEYKIGVPRFSIRESGRFVWFLISSTLVFTGFRAAGTFYPLLLIQKGGDNKALGLSLFIMAVSEVPVLFLSKKLLTKYKDTALITISMFFFILRIFLHITMSSVAGLIAIQLTQGLSFALFLPASVYYIKRISPQGLGSTYLTIASSCYFGVAGIAGNLLGGLLIDNFGIYNMLWWGIAVTVAGLFVFVISHNHDSCSR
ncbi:MAG: MFS transporter [Saccharofermentanales bacterium]